MAHPHPHPPTPHRPTPTLVIINPASGARSAPSIAQDIVLPLLNASHQRPRPSESESESESYPSSESKAGASEAGSSEAGDYEVKVVTTDAPGHAGELLREFVADLLATAAASESAAHLKGGIVDVDVNVDLSVDVVLLSGDGTLQELINASVVPAPTPTSTAAPASSLGRAGSNNVRINVALVPCGTANALYHSLFDVDVEGTTDAVDREWMLRGVQALLSPSPPTPLRLARTTFYPPPPSPPSSSSSSDPPPDKKTFKTHLSSVVVSTSLHATILHVSERLRASHPGIERFKIAAYENVSRWYDARVVLRARGRVGRYDSRRKEFVDVHVDASTGDRDEEGEHGGGGHRVELQGPFSYFLSTSTVDRLEAKFVIAPLQKLIPPPLLSSSSSSHLPPPTLDIVVIRPLRDPRIGDASEGSRKRYAETVGRVLGEAYNKGAHVDLRYPSSSSSSGGDASGDGRDEEGEGEEIVEYYRCEGWEWIPAETDESAHLVCIDGLVSSIEKGGRAVCRAVTWTGGSPGAGGVDGIEGDSGEGKGDGVRFSVYC